MYVPIDKMLLLLLLVGHKNVFQNVESQSIINFQNVSSDIYGNIFIYYIQGPTTANRTKINLEDGLNLLNQPGFDPHRETIFYMHGWDSDINSDYNCVIEAYLARRNRNVVFFSYSSLMKYNNFLWKPIFYMNSVRNVSVIGEAIGHFLKAYIPEIQPKELVHMVSHSLGCHIMGKAGRTFGTGQLWLTALDPAGPLFNFPWQFHLSSSDGSFVDVVHTNDFELGDGRNIGTVDFYPNGGTFQPGCFLNFITVCSHKRAGMLYAESILNETALPAKNCLTPFSWFPIPHTTYQCNDTDVAYLGPRVNKSAHGNYYMRTGSSSPFGLGKAGLNL